MNKTFCKSADGDAVRMLWSGSENLCLKCTFISVGEKVTAPFMKEGVHCCHPPTAWLANPPRNGTMLGTRHHPLLLAGWVLDRGGSQICFGTGKCVAFFPALGHFTSTRVSN